MKIKIYFIIVFSILMLSTSVTGSSSSTDSSTLLTNIPHVDDPIPVSNDVVSIPSEKKVEYVFFTRTDTEFNELLQLNPVKVYENLKAVVLKQYPSDIELFEITMPNRIFQYSQYKQARFIDTISSPSSIILNNGPDDEILDVTRLWNAGYNGTNTNVAVFDNGVLTSHPGLTGKVVKQKSVNIIDGKAEAICRDHGTPVAGTIVASGNKEDGTNDTTLRGMAFGAELTDISIGCVGENGLWGDLLEGFDWILANNATIDVINTSWGGGNPSIWVEPIRKLAMENVILVGSSGNAGERFTSGGPGAAAEAISSGAIDYRNVLTRFSSKGPVFDLRYKPDLLAPGENVITTLVDKTYGPISGTSFSSPLTAGAIATLISALKANNVKYNVGVLKAALMNNATSLNIPELDQGKGIVQAYKSFQNIMNAELGSDNVPMVVDMSPRLDALPISYLKNIFQDLTTTIPFTIIASHMADVKVSFTGDLATILSFDESSLDGSRYTQNLFLNLDTFGVSSGVYSGEIIVELGSKAKVSAQYSFNVKGKAKAKMMMDLAHTTWDSGGQDVIGGSNTGEFIQTVVEKDIWVEQYDGEITTAVLSNYDIYWMPDPMSLDYSDPSDPFAIRVDPLTQSEIDAIVKFVDDGGSVFIDFNGKLNVDDVDFPIGTDSVAMNKLITNFGITTGDVAVDTPGAAYIAKTVNITSPVGGVTGISHYGNFLTVEGQAKGIVEAKEGFMTAIYDQINGGRVLVTDTNFWLDNIGMKGGYGAKDRDPQFARNMLDWFSSDIQVKFISSEVTGTKITGKFQVLENGAPITTTPVVKRLSNDLLSETTITPTKDGDSWTFTYDASEDGIHNLQVAYGTDYAKWQIVVDNNEPTIIPYEDKNPNKSVLSKSSSTFLFFEVKDAISILDKTDFTFELDGTAIGNTEDNLEMQHSYVPEDYKLIILLYEDAFTEADDHIYTFTIFVNDDLNNTGIYDYLFAFSNVTFPADTLTTSDGLTSNTVEEPINGIYAVFALFVLATSVYKKKK